MTTDARSPADDEPTMGPDALSYERYDAVETADDELILYDTRENDGWIQSSAYVTLADSV